jgi:hypothetical protein
MRFSMANNMLFKLKTPLTGQQCRIPKIQNASRNQSAFHTTQAVKPKTASPHTTGHRQKPQNRVRHHIK